MVQVSRTSQTKQCIDATDIPTDDQKQWHSKILGGPCAGLSR